MSDKKKNRRNGDYYGTPNQNQGSYRNNNFGSVQPGSPQQSYEETQCFNIGDRPQPRHPVDNRQFQRPAGGQQPQQQYPQNPYPPQYQQPYQGQQYPNQPQMNNYYGGAQPPYGQPQYQQNPYPPQYQQPPYRHRDEEEEEKGTSMGTVLLIMITLILVLGIAGGIILLIVKKDDGASSSSGSSHNNAVVTEADTETETQSETETEASSEEDTTATKSELVEVPKVEGNSLEVAKLKLESAGLKAIEEYEYSDKVKKDSVISQSIPEGVKVASDTEVKIVVSKGIEAKMPNLVGMDYVKARETMAKYNITLKVSSSEYNDKYAENQVISQSVKANSELSADTKVTVVISKGSDPSANKSGKLFDSPKKGKVVTQETVLNVRDEPSYDSNIAGTIERGATIELIGESGDWYIINFKGKQKYVSKEYVRIS